MPKNLLRYTVIVYALAVTLLRTFRLPNDWAEAHWLLGYGLGIYKRGLVGSLVSAAFPPSQAHAAELFIIIASLVLTAVAVGIALRICFRQPVAVALVMVSSPLVVMWGHLTGYFDFFLFMLTFLALVAVKKQRYFVASFVLTLGALIHESMLVLGFPVVGFAVLYTHLFSETKNTIRQTAVHLVTTYALPVLVMVPLLFMVSQQETHARIMAFLEAYRFMHDRVGVIADAHNTSFFTYYKNESPLFMERLFHTLYVSLYVSVAYFIVYLYTRLSKQKKVLFLVYPIVLLPLLLHLIAWDTARIWTYPLMEILLLFFVLENRPHSPTYDRTVALLFSGLVIGVQAFYAIPLMDEQTEHFSDFVKLLLYIPVWAYLLYLAFRRKSPTGIPDL